jgi:hypothetical protein
MDESNVRLIPCIADGYEPYVVVPWCPTVEDAVAAEGDDSWEPKSPYYDERFYSYGMNKVQHVKHLQAQGYQFGVIPALGFLTHYPHKVSSLRKMYVRGLKDPTEEGLATKMKKLFDQYKKELSREYKNTEVRTSICIDDQEQQGSGRNKQVSTHQAGVETQEVEMLMPALRTEVAQAAANFSLHKEDSFSLERKLQSAMSMIMTPAPVTANSNAPNLLNNFLSGPAAAANNEALGAVAANGATAVTNFVVNAAAATNNAAGAVATNGATAVFSYFENAAAVTNNAVEVATANGALATNFFDNATATP